jgi:hypothetical protein
MVAIVGIEKERDDATASRPAINLPSTSLDTSARFPRQLFALLISIIHEPFHEPLKTEEKNNMSEVKDESDFDMLFDDSPDISDNQDLISSVGPQLSRPNQHSSVITQIEAVFEIVADALLNERADVTISLISISSNEPRDTSVRTPKSVFTFPGKTANDAWRFCR